MVNYMRPVVVFYKPGAILACRISTAPQGHKNNVLSSNKLHGVVLTATHLCTVLVEGKVVNL